MSGYHSTFNVNGNRVYNRIQSDSLIWWGKLGSWILIKWGDIHPVILICSKTDIGKKALVMAGLPLTVCSVCHLFNGKVWKLLFYIISYKWRDKQGNFWKSDIDVLNNQMLSFTTTFLLAPTKYSIFSTILVIIISIVAHIYIFH